MLRRPWLRCRWLLSSYLLLSFVTLLRLRHGCCVLSSQVTDLQQQLAFAGQPYSKQKKKPEANALLSLAAGTAPAQFIMHTFSETSDINEGSLVSLIRAKKMGSKTVEGVVMSINRSNNTCDIEVWERTLATKRKRWQTRHQEHDEVFAGMEKTSEKLLCVPLAEVLEVGRVRVTDHLLKEVLFLKQRHHAGKILGTEPLWTRLRKSTLHHEIMAEHYDNPELFPLRFSSDKGAKYFRALPIKKSFKIAIEACKAAGCEVPRWEDYLNTLSSSDYKQQTAVNCVCVYCRVLGLETFDEIIDIISFLSLPDNLVKHFEERTNRFRTYVCVEYSGKLVEQSPNAWYCLRYALTTSGKKTPAAHVSHGISLPGVSTRAQCASAPVLAGGALRG